MSDDAPHPDGDGNPHGPYRVEQVNGRHGPRWRLTGPGLEGAKAYPWQEFRDKLEELAALMNFAWRAGRAAPAGRRRDQPATD